MDGGAFGIGRRDGGGCIDGAQQHFLGPAAAGDEADAGFDQADVGFGVGLAARGVQAHLGAAAEGHAEGRDDDGTRTELDELGHLLEGADGSVDLVPLAFLRGEEKLHEVGADAEVVAVAGDDEAQEVADGFRFGLEDGGDQRDHVAADGVLERVQLDAGDAVADVDERCAGVGADDLVGAAEIGDAGVAGLLRDGLPGVRGGVVALRAVGRVPGWVAGIEERGDGEADGERRGLHARYGVFQAGGVPHFERSQLPVEAGAHGAVDGRSVVGGFADNPGGEVPERGEQRPEECGGLVFSGVCREKQAETLGEAVAAFFAISSEGMLGLARGRYSRVLRSRTRRSSLCRPGRPCPDFL